MRNCSTNTLPTGVGVLYDIDVTADGSLLAGSHFEWVAVSHADFGSLSTFHSTQNLPVFTSFTMPVPEPEVGGAVLLGVALFFRRRLVRSREGGDGRLAGFSRAVFGTCFSRR